MVRTHAIDSVIGAHAEVGPFTYLRPGTNLGDQGVDSLFGVIIAPQVAIVGFGRLAVRPWVTEAGNVAAVPTVTASLSADHRVSDGHTGARFLNALDDWLQRPEDL